MSLVFNAKTYTLDSQISANKVNYTGAAKTLSVKDDVSLARVAPKPTAAFSGVGRTESKLTRTLALTNALTATGDLIVTINVSAPVGAASADIDSALNDFAAFMATATYKTLAKSLTVNF